MTGPAARVGISPVSSSSSSSTETYKTTAARLLRGPGLPVPQPMTSYWQVPAHELAPVRCSSALTDPSSTRPRPCASPTSTTDPFSSSCCSSSSSSPLPPSAEVLIIGSGVTGCSVAFSLLRDPRFHGTVLLLEARSLCSGATGRNGGHIATHPVIDYAELRERGVAREEAIKICGFQLGHYEMLRRDLEEVDDEMRLWEEEEEEMKEVEERVEQEKMMNDHDHHRHQKMKTKKKKKTIVEQCEIRRVISHCGIIGQEKVRKMKAAFERLSEEVPEFAGRAQWFEGAEACKTLHMPGVDAVITEPAGAIWPYRAFAPLFSYLLTRFPDRFRVETQTPVERVSRGQTAPYKAHTPRGEVHVQQVVYACNAYTAHLLPALRGKLFPVQGHMTVQPADSGRLAMAHRGRVEMLSGNKQEEEEEEEQEQGEKGEKEGREEKEEISNSYSFIFDVLGLNYLTINPVSGERFYGGGLVKGRDDGLRALGNWDDGAGSVDQLVLRHLVRSLRAWFDGDGDEQNGDESIAKQEQENDDEEEDRGGEGESGSGKGDSARETQEARVKSAWTGVMGFTGDGLPLVGRVPDAFGAGYSLTDEGGSEDGREGGGGGEWIAAGFNGYGMVNCWGCGKALVSMMLGQDVSSAFPESYLITEDRLAGLDVETAVEGLLGPEA